jgi:hypothetical protein
MIHIAKRRRWFERIIIANVDTVIAAVIFVVDDRTEYATDWRSRRNEREREKTESVRRSPNPNSRRENRVNIGFPAANTAGVKILSCRKFYHYFG